LGTFVGRLVGFGVELGFDFVGVGEILAGVGVFAAVGSMVRMACGVKTLVEGSAMMLEVCELGTGVVQATSRKLSRSSAVNRTVGAILKGIVIIQLRMDDL